MLTVVFESTRNAYTLICYSIITHLILIQVVGEFYRISKYSSIIENVFNELLIIKQNNC